jgi:hypothetical protein
MRMRGNWRNLEQERQEAMHRAEIRDSLRQSYANRFSSKNEPANNYRPMNPRKLKKIKNLYKRCIILSNEIKEREMRK